MNWKGFGHGLIYITILASGLLRVGSVPGERSFQVPQKRQTGKVTIREMKQTVSYIRWPVATTVINTVSHYLISKEEDKKICNRVRPWAPFHTARPQLFVFGSSPLVSTALHLC
jgi:hypothetical protein